MRDRGEIGEGVGRYAAELRASCVGAGQIGLIEDGRPMLGTGQGIYFCEFDGPRTRRFQVKVLGDGTEN